MEKKLKLKINLLLLCSIYMFSCNSNNRTSNFTIGWFRHVKYDDSKEDQNLKNTINASKGKFGIWSLFNMHFADVNNQEFLNTFTKNAKKTKNWFGCSKTIFTYKYKKKEDPKKGNIINKLRANNQNSNNLSDNNKRKKLIEDLFVNYNKIEDFRESTIEYIKTIDTIDTNHKNFILGQKLDYIVSSDKTATYWKKRELEEILGFNYNLVEELYKSRCLQCLSFAA